jgi:hypothetical protein
MSFDHFYFTTCLPTNISVCYPTASPLVWSQRFLSDHQSVTTGFYHRMFCLATFMSLLTTVVLSSIWSQGSYVNSGWLLGLVKQISVWLQYVPPDLITQISILCRYSNFLSDRKRASTLSGHGKSSACSQPSHHFVSPGRFLPDYRSHLRFDHMNFCLIITDPRTVYSISLDWLLPPCNGFTSVLIAQLSD